MNRVSVKTLLVWITYKTLVHVSRCDLPNHATIHDVHGKWKLSSSTERSQPDSCGSKAPNENLDNLAQDDEIIWRETPVAKSRIIYLSDERIPLRDIFGREQLKASSEVLDPAEIIIGRESPQFRLSWNMLPVYEELVDENGSLIQKLIGHWTMTFDEGFEVVLVDTPESGNVSRFQFILKYRKVDKDHCVARSPANGDNENPDGSTPCYETDPSTTFVGWGTISRGDGKKFYSCVQGSKVDVLPISGRLPFEKLATVQVVTMPKTYQTHGIRTAKKAESRSLLIDDTSIGFSFLQSQHYSTIHTGLYACIRDTLGLDSSLPSQFTWGDPFNVPKWSHFPDEKSMNQGGCGSCYAIASAYVLQERSKALLKFLLGDDHDVGQYFAGDRQLSPQSILSCSYFSQGCNGGLPYNVGRFSENIGIPTRACMDYMGSDQAPCSMKDVDDAIRGVSRNHSSRNKNKVSPSAILSPTTGFFPKKFLQRENTSNQCDNRVFALNYGYVGGCYECCAERHMMEEVFHGGPIIVAFDAPSELFSYKDGVFEKSPSSHTKICSDPGKGLNGWEFTTHALVLVGWGEDEESGPYWILRNSWGNKWGRDGYFKLKRGKNIGGVEAQAVFIDPDPTRGMLKSILEMNGVPKEKLNAVRRNGLQYKIQTPA